MLSRLPVYLSDDSELCVVVQVWPTEGRGSSSLYTAKVRAPESSPAHYTVHCREVEVSEEVSA